MPTDARVAAANWSNGGDAGIHQLAPFGVIRIPATSSRSLASATSSLQDVSQRPQASTSGIPHLAGESAACARAAASQQAPRRSAETNRRQIAQREPDLAAIAEEQLDVVGQRMPAAVSWSAYAASWSRALGRSWRESLASQTR